MRLFAVIYSLEDKATNWSLLRHTGANGDAIQVFTSWQLADRAMHEMNKGLRIDLAVDKKLKVVEVHWQLRQELLQAAAALPWAAEPFWADRPKAIRDLYAHVSAGDPTMIAFTASEAHGEADRQTRMKPGKFLKKYFPDMTARKVAYYAEWLLSGEAPCVERDDLKLAFAYDAKEIVRVYSEGPSSCMAGSRAGTSSRPVQAYASGDLAIAYVHDECGSIFARVLVYPKGKSYSRIYTQGRDSTEVEAFLKSQLRKDGYVSLNEEPDRMNGAKIVPVQILGMGYLPYLDRGGIKRESMEDGSVLYTLDRNSHCDETIYGDYLCNYPETPPEIAARMQRLMRLETKYDRRAQRQRQIAALRKACEDSKAAMMRRLFNAENKVRYYEERQRERAQRNQEWADRDIARYIAPSELIPSRATRGNMIIADTV